MNEPRRPTALPAPLDALAKRFHARIMVPRTEPVYARVRASAHANAGCRCLVRDLSAAGLAAHVIEGGELVLPPEGQDATIDLNYEGGEALVTGRVIRSGPSGLSVAYPPEPRDDAQNVALLSLIARLATRSGALERQRGDGLAARLGHEHVSSTGTLEIRVRVGPPAWWQLVFLEYLISWSEVRGLETGLIDRASSAVTRHPAPWRSLVEVGALIAGRCRVALPELRDGFDLIAQRLQRGR